MRLSAHTRARLQALLVAFLWATSWVFIKIGLHDIPALTFAGLRYALAFLCLLPVLWYSKQHHLGSLSKSAWLQLIALGVLLYGVTQGSQFLSLFYLPAVTTNLLLSFSTILVALLGIFTLGEVPTWRQWGGVALYLAGVWLYFYPVAVPMDQRLGLAIALVGVLANAFSSLLGRAVNRRRDISPLQITVVSMGCGAAVLLATGVAVQGMPRLSVTSWLIVAWLAVINTAFAFTLWNHTLRILSAMESSILNSTMMLQIPILAWVFLDERLNYQEVTGLVVAGLGILIVQLRRVSGQAAARDMKAGLPSR